MCARFVGSDKSTKWIGVESSTFATSVTFASDLGTYVSDVNWGCSPLMKVTLERRTCLLKRVPRATSSATSPWSCLILAP